MTFFDACIPGSTLWAVGYGLQNGSTFSESHVALAAPAGPNVHGELAVNAAVAPTAGTVITIWLTSGPGPVFTDEAKLVEYVGVHAFDQVVEGTWVLTRVLPIAGRPWNWQTDGFRFNFNGVCGPTTGSNSFNIQSGVCSAQSSVADCCAELNAKLDTVIAAVQRVFVNQP